jgi:hypothetical protein
MDPVQAAAGGSVDDEQKATAPCGLHTQTHLLSPSPPLQLHPAEGSELRMNLDDAGEWLSTIWEEEHVVTASIFLMDIKVNCQILKGSCFCRCSAINILVYVFHMHRLTACLRCWTAREGNPGWLLRRTSHAALSSSSTL